MKVNPLTLSMERLSMHEIYVVIDSEDYYAFNDADVEKMRNQII